MDREADAARTIQHAVPARRAGTGSLDRRHRHAHLPDVHVRAGGARPHKGYEYARAEPTREASRHNLAAIGREKGSPSRRAWRHRRWRRAVAGDPSSSPTTLGGTFRLFDKVLSRYGCRFPTWTPRGWTRWALPPTRACCLSRRPLARSCRSRTSRRRPLATATAHAWS
jgi:hypothetical protein